MEDTVKKRKPKDGEVNKIISLPKNVLKWYDKIGKSERSNAKATIENILIKHFEQAKSDKK